MVEGRIKTQLYTSAQERQCACHPGTGGNATGKEIIIPVAPVL